MRQVVMTNRWRHLTCISCYAQRYPGQETVMQDVHPWTMCCWCGTHIAHGVYERDDPNSVPCKGMGGPHLPVVGPYESIP